MQPKLSIKPRPAEIQPFLRFVALGGEVLQGGTETLPSDPVAWAAPGRGVEDVRHILFECHCIIYLFIYVCVTITLHRDMLTLFPDLLQPPQEAPPSLKTFLGGPLAPLAKYAQGCRRLARQRKGLPP